MVTHILHTPMEEVRREAEGERWCFKCRKRREFVRVVTTPITVFWCDLKTRKIESNTGAWYGPSARIECDTCHLVDGDCFPGTYREWED